jgi:hypothetical protein
VEHTDLTLEGVHLPDCLECELLGLAVEVATERHLAIVNRLVIATMEGQVDIIPALEAARSEAERTRENAQDAYRFHIGNHRVSISGGAA